jgi:lipid-binding SYLF domain-containing protein
MRGKKKMLEGDHKRKLLTSLSSILFAVAPLLAEAASAADQTKDNDRLQNCGTVLKEILNVPDDIPQDLLDKADCVVVFPSVLKAAFIFGASYGRGSKSCLTGEDFSGPWGAPTSYSRARGLFAGISLEGSTIRPDNGDNQRVYARKIPATNTVLSRTVAVPSSSQAIGLDPGRQDPEVQAIGLLNYSTFAMR